MAFTSSIPPAGNASSVGQVLINRLTRSIVSIVAGRPYLLANVRNDSEVRDQQSNSVGITISSLKWKRYWVLHTAYVPSEDARRAELPRLLSIDNVRGPDQCLVLFRS